MLRHAHHRVALVAAITLSLAAPAQGQEAAPEQAFPAGGPAMTHAYQTAVSHWQQAPCQNAVALQWADLAADTHALSSWSAPTASSPASEYRDCRIDFNRHIPFDYARLCSAMLHEVGHLLGKPHNDTPGDVMNHEYTVPVGPCAQHATADPADAEPVADAAPRRATTTLKRTARKKPCARGKRRVKVRGKSVCRARKPLKKR